METAEYNVLRKYVKGRDIDNKDDIFTLKRFMSIGLVKRIGFSFERGTRTSVLTDEGKRKIKRECVYRNPVRRFLHNWYVQLVR